MVVFINILLISHSLIMIWHSGIDNNSFSEHCYYQLLFVTPWLGQGALM